MPDSHLNNKNTPEDLLEKAEQLYERKKYRQAREAYQSYLRHDNEMGTSQVAMYYVGKCYEQENNYEKAKTIYEQLINQYQNGFWVEKAKERILK